jgi:hypothetical protein
MKTKLFTGFLLCTATLKLFIILFFGVHFVSCTKEQGPTLQEYDAQQKKIIQSFIEKEGIEVLSEYPECGVFSENQFVLLKNGCYLHVVDSGNGRRAIPEITTALVKCHAYNMMAEKYLLSDSEKPVQFIFGKADSIINDLWEKSDSPEYLFLSKGLESALNYVGDNAKVKMIIPFCTLNEGTEMLMFSDLLGSVYQTTNYIPLFYDEILFQLGN